jgi:hypothetical protein
MRLARGCLALGLVLALLTGCDATGGSPASPAPVSIRPASALVPGQIFAGVIQNVTSGTTVYVLARTEANAGGGHWPGAGPLSEEVRSEILLWPLPPGVEFVTSREDVLEPDPEFEGGSRVINGGTLVTLGPIQDHGDRAEVGVSTFRSPLDAAGYRCTLVLGNQGWTIEDCRGTFIA